MALQHRGADPVLAGGIGGVGEHAAGEVGCEGFLLGAEGVPTLFLPLTYRSAELDGAEEHLVGTTEHSELGPRWVYDGCADAVFIGELVRAVLTGGTGVDYEYDIGDGPESRPTAWVGTHLQVFVPPRPSWPKRHPLRRSALQVAEGAKRTLSILARSKACITCW